jgi:hypothetical protein
MVVYDLSKINAWEELFTYIEHEDDPYEEHKPSDLDPITQQIIISSHWFNIPVLDDEGLREWLIRQDIVVRLDAWGDPIKPEDLFRRHGLVIEGDYLETKEWFETKLYRMVEGPCVTGLKNKPNMVHAEYIKEKELIEKRKNLTLIKS